MIKKLSFLFVLFVLAVGAMAAAKQAADQVQKIDIGPAEAWTPGTIKPFPQYKIIVFADKDGVYAMSAACPHRGCVVRFKANENVLSCPCHSAQFTYEGVVRRGPAASNLAWLEVSRGANGRLSVDKTKTVPQGTKWRAP